MQTYTPISLWSLLWLRQLMIYKCNHVKLKFHFFLECVYISFCLSPQFAFCFVLSYKDVQNNKSNHNQFRLKNNNNVLIKIFI